jgi:hypothetical protein
MPNEPRRQVQDIFLTCATPQFNSPQETTPRGHTITAMTTTTFTAATVTSTLVGSIAMPADGLRDYPRMIKLVVGTTATVDKAWNNTTGVSVIRTWQPPDVPIVLTASANTGAVTSAAHASITNEPDHYWDASTKGYFLVGYTGANAGTANKFTNFATVSAAGQWTMSPVLAAVTPGDLFLIRKLLRPEAPPEIVVNMKTVERRIVGFKDADAAIPVNIEATVGFTLPQRPIGTGASAAGVFPTEPLEIGDLLQDFMTPTLQAGMTVSSATGSTITVSSATAAVGGFVLLNTGEAAQLLSVASTVYTTGTSQFTAASVSATVAIGSAWYQMKTADFRNRLFDLYRGRIHRHLICGCFPTLDIEITRDQLVKFAFKYTGDSAFEYPAADPVTSTTRKIPILDTTVPFDGKAARFLLNGVKVLCGDMKISMGISPVPRPSIQGVNQSDGMAVQLDPVKFTTTILADQDDVSGFEAMTDRLRGGDVIQMLYQKGSAATQTFCIGMPAAQLTKAAFVYANGQGEYQIEGVCQLPAVSGLGDTIPAIALGWL